MRLCIACRMLGLLGLVLLFAGVEKAEASQEVKTLGNPNFTDGSFPDGANGFNTTSSASEPAPFDIFRGSDFDTPFSENWTFTYGALPDISAASITLGIFDHDSQAPGSQISSFTVDGNNLTSILDTAFESFGGSQNEYNVYAVTLPELVFPDLEDGSATFSLILQAPGLQEGLELASGNGAGLDFATLSIEAVPEPSSALGLLAFGALGAVSVLKRKHKQKSTQK